MQKNNKLQADFCKTCQYWHNFTANPKAVFCPPLKLQVKKQPYQPLPCANAQGSPRLYAG
ncbi:hypothetical protein C7N43_03880 [Sphingobacteriales bacterium UPWRP_1]|nr:hypothetical protein B6N25_05520 [Sphingobacteriales bacterium TSM_CSS]PSJ78351.1 hypothetical protein C7N43_03880 [Sphingobacteriales bacterium UPWRP_1]